ncbi:GerMN domain-containing protein [Coriobacteriia bacterium Es71-Z0120]|uniref:GerMN domain-containing protein n=1 Tax=Parvivirga hydrogeniphila TaxID=2939460 RepID=UPI002260EE9B|nr:GerMN domain-containing protein [Parvivirga hydrogeniphila]MCL4078384.1 GerMN domain-containing protein [Parvivirga hydrogeniphila]
MARRLIAFCTVLAILALAVTAWGCARKPVTSTEDATGSRPATEEPTAQPLPPEDGSSETTAPPAGGSGSSTSKTLALSVYYPRGEKLGVVVRQVPYTKAVATAALNELLKGPSSTDAAYGFHTEIPAGTRLRSVSIRDRVATVDLTGEFDDGGGSLSMFMRLAQLVFTATQFDTVDAVTLKLDGRPVDVFSGEGIVIDHPMQRKDFEDMLPAIFVESPRPGESARSPLRISGTANVFEAVFKAEVRDAAGTVVGSKTIMASSGTGTRGTFADTVPFTVTRVQMGSLVVFAESPRDGSRIDVVTIPVKLLP